jgi:hypothetical protein
MVRVAALIGTEESGAAAGFLRTVSIVQAPDPRTQQAQTIRMARTA